MMTVQFLLKEVKPHLYPSGDLNKNKNKDKKMSNLTEDLRQWRADRNITKCSYIGFVENILEELLEPLYDKNTTDDFKKRIIQEYFPDNEWFYNNKSVVDAIQDIQVFCINETELMGYDNIKCNKEIFSEINSREQDPIQKEEWLKNGAVGKWQKDKFQKDWTLYKANYESCKL